MMLLFAHLHNLLLQVVPKRSRGASRASCARWGGVRLLAGASLRSASARAQKETIMMTGAAAQAPSLRSAFCESVLRVPAAQAKAKRNKRSQHLFCF